MSRPTSVSVNPGPSCSASPPSRPTRPQCRCPMRNGSYADRPLTESQISNPRFQRRTGRRIGTILRGTARRPLRWAWRSEKAGVSSSEAASRRRWRWASGCWWRRAMRTRFMRSTCQRANRPGLSRPTGGLIRRRPLSAGWCCSGAPTVGCTACGSKMARSLGSSWRRRASAGWSASTSWNPRGRFTAPCWYVRV